MREPTSLACLQLLQVAIGVVRSVGLVIWRCVYPLWKVFLKVCVSRDREGEQIPLSARGQWGRGSREGIRVCDVRSSKKTKRALAQDVEHLRVSLNVDDPVMLMEVPGQEATGVWICEEVDLMEDLA